jgi:hypothetical protein
MAVRHVSSRIIHQAQHHIRSQIGSTKDTKGDHSEIMKLEQALRDRLAFIQGGVDLILSQRASNDMIRRAVERWMEEVREFCPSAGPDVEAVKNESVEKSLDINDLTRQLASASIEEPKEDKRLSVDQIQGKSKSPESAAVRQQKVELEALQEKYKRFMEKLDAFVPYLQLALALSTTASPSMSRRNDIPLSVLLRASHMVQSALDKKSCMATVRVFSLFVASVRVKSQIQWSWKELLPMAACHTQRVSSDSIKYNLIIEQDLDDGMYHEETEEPSVITIPVSSIECMFYATASKLLRIDETSHPCIIIKYKKQQKEEDDGSTAPKDRTPVKSRPTASTDYIALQLFDDQDEKKEAMGVLETALRLEMIECKVQQSHLEMGDDELQELMKNSTLASRQEQSSHPIDSDFQDSPLSAKTRPRTLFK